MLEAARRVSSVRPSVRGRKYPISSVSWAVSTPPVTSTTACSRKYPISTASWAVRQPTTIGHRTNDVLKLSSVQDYYLNYFVFKYFKYNFCFLSLSHPYANFHTMEKMLLTRGKSNNSRNPRSATSAARNSSGSRMRKFVRRSQRIESPCGTAGFKERYTPPARVWARRDVTACGIAGFNESCMPQDLEGVLETETDGGTAGFKERCTPRKFVRLPSVRAENRLRRKPETARHRQGLKGATSGLEYEPPTGAGNCKSLTATQAVSLYRRRAGVTEAGNCAPQTATARMDASFTGTGVPLASTRPTSTPTARTAVSFTGTPSVGFVPRLGLCLRLEHPHPALAPLIQAIKSSEFHVYVRADTRCSPRPRHSSEQPFRVSYLPAPRPYSRQPTLHSNKQQFGVSYLPAYLTAPRTKRGCSIEQPFRAAYLPCAKGIAQACRPGSIEQPFRVSYLRLGRPYPSLAQRRRRPFTSRSAKSTARTSVSFTGTNACAVAVTWGAGSTARASVSFTGTAPTEAGSGRPQAVPDDCSVNRRGASLRGRIQCCITRCKSGSLAGSGWHQCAGVSNASSQNFIAIPLFQAIKMISILFHRCHTPMIFSIS